MDMRSTAVQRNRITDADGSGSGLSGSAVGRWRWKLDEGSERARCNGRPAAGRRRRRRRVIKRKFSELHSPPPFRRPAAIQRCICGRKSRASVYRKSTRFDCTKLECTTAHIRAQKKLRATLAWNCLYTMTTTAPMQNFPGYLSVTKNSPTKFQNYFYVFSFFDLQIWFYEMCWFHPYRSFKHSKWWRHKLGHT